ncbi:hypothetical protein V8F33_005938 [Rhypophila sp. PSN 637]
MAAIPNLAMLEHGIELTQRGPNGGWRVWGSHRGGSNNVNVGLTATVTADVEVSGTIAATVEQVCPNGLHIKMCSPGFCSDLEADAENCGSCGAECPWNAECDPDKYTGNIKGTCIRPAEKSKLCEPANALPYCANIWGEFIPNRNEENGDDEYDGGDVFNCGACGYKCPQADWHGDYTPGYCFPTQNPGMGEKPAHCDCGNGYKLCGADSTFGGGVCAPNKDDKYCGPDFLDCAETGKVCDFDDDDDVWEFVPPPSP